MGVGTTPLVRCVAKNSLVRSGLSKTKENRNWTKYFDTVNIYIWCLIVSFILGLNFGIICLKMLRFVPLCLPSRLLSRLLPWTSCLLRYLVCLFDLVSEFAFFLFCFVLFLFLFLFFVVAPFDCLSFPLIGCYLALAECNKWINK